MTTRILIPAIIFVVLGFALALLLPSSRNTFPAIASGMYTGSITGLSSSDKTSPFFVERLPESNIFVVVILHDGLRPQAVMAEPFREAPPEEPLFMPLPFTFENRNLILAGKLHEGNLRGELIEKGQRIGTWELKPRKIEDIIASNSLGDPPDALLNWLKSKNDQRRLRREIRGLENELLAEQEKRNKLEGFVQDEKLLQQRAALRRDELAMQLREAVATRKKVAAELQTLTKELENLGNITRTGQAITLARRVAHRENQWYLANWDEVGAAPVLDESLGIGTKIDYQKLEQQVRKANEIQAMLQELASERAKNSALRKELQAAGEPNREDLIVEPAGAMQPGPQQGPSPLSDEERPSERKSLWDRIF